MLTAEKLLHPGRRLTGWAKAAAKANPGLVLQLSELPSGISKRDLVCAATINGRASHVPAAASSTSGGRGVHLTKLPTFRARTQPPWSCWARPCDSRAGGRHHFYYHNSFLSVRAHSIGEEGHDGPADGLLAAGQVRHGGETVRSCTASPCTWPNTHKERLQVVA